MTSLINTNQSKPLLIIGGGGFLGSNLTKHLRDCGYKVINISRSHLLELDDTAVTYLPLNTEELEQLVAQSGGVFHMAHGSSPASAFSDMEANLTATMNLNFLLMRACAGSQIPLFYLSSGGAIYGPDVPVPTPETAATSPISPYGAEKLAAERYLHIAQRHLGLNYRVLRISNPYGPWQLGRHGQGVIGTWMRKILMDENIEIWGDGNVRRDYIYVDDVCQAMLCLLSYEGPIRTFNIGSGYGYSLNEILEQLRLIVGDNLRVSYRDAAPSHVPISTLNADLAQAELGWKATTSLASGMKNSWKWACDHGLQYMW